MQENQNKQQNTRAAAQWNPAMKKNRGDHRRRHRTDFVVSKSISSSSRACVLLRSEILWTVATMLALCSCNFSHHPCDAKTYPPEISPGMVTTTTNRPLLRGVAGDGSRAERKAKSTRNGLSTHMEIPELQTQTRMLWRNETPRDDDDSFVSTSHQEHERKHREDNSHHQNITIGATLVVVDKQTTGNETTTTTTKDDDDVFYDVIPIFPTNNTEATDDLFANETIGMLEDDEQDDEAIPTQQEEDNSYEIMGDEENIDDNNDADGVDDDDDDHNDNNDDDRNEDQNEDETQQPRPPKKDCLWRVLTGTGCTGSSSQGDETGNGGSIIQGYQHDYLVADGTCRYNDFLGYYRAGCQQQQATSTFSATTRNTVEFETNTDATIVLEAVFCYDPKCSSGCMDGSVVHPSKVYTSNTCYASSYYYKKGLMMSKEEENDTHYYYPFGFEFVGGCFESENCHNYSIS